MTRSTTSNRASFIGNGIATNLPFDFPIASASDLVVFQPDAFGNSNFLLQDSDYTVTVNGTKGGSVELAVAPAVGVKTTVKRMVALDQPTSIRNQGAFFPSIHEDVFDHLVDIDVQQQEQLDRSLQVDPSAADFSSTLPLPVPSQVLGYNGAGTGFTTYPVSGITPAALLDAVLAGNGDALMAVKALVTGAVATTQHEVNERARSLLDFGPTADRTGSADASAIFRLAAASGAKHIRVPSGTYKVSGNNVITIADGQTWDFDHVTLNWTGTGTQACIYQADKTDWGIRGRLTIVGSGLASGTVYGFRSIGGQRFLVENLTVKNIPGWGICQDAGGSFVAPRGDQGRYVNCSTYACWRGTENVYSAANEYITWVNHFAAGCGEWGIIDGSGNNQWIGGNCVDNVAGGFQVNGAGGGNSAHGEVIGMNINHNGTDNIFCNAVINGYSFTGCHIYGDSVSTGLIHLTGSQGVSISNGIIDAAVVADGTPARNDITDNHIAGTEFFNSITGAAAKMLFLKDNRTPTGPHINNDLAWAYAVAVGGMALTSGATTTLVSGTVQTDLRNNYDETTGLFTCPDPGLYTVNAALAVIATGVPVGWIQIVRKRGAVETIYGPQALSQYDSGTATAHTWADIICLAGDTLRVEVKATATGPAVYGPWTQISFQGKGARTS